MVTAIAIVVRYSKEYVRKTILIPKPPNCDETGDDDDDVLGMKLFITIITIVPTECLPG